MKNIAKNNDRQWQIIEKVLFKRNKPTIIWISSNDYFARTELIDTFKKRFAKNKHQVVSLKNFSENSFKTFFEKKLPSDFFSANNTNKMVHLIDLESCIYPHLSENKKEHFIRILNYEREVLFNDFPFYIIFWSDTFTMKQVQRSAPDFYDWIGYKFNFESYPEDNKQKHINEINSNSTAFFDSENVIYNRISRRLNTLEKVPIDNINDRFSLLSEIVQDYTKVNDFIKAEEAVKELLNIKNLSKKQKAKVYLLQADNFSELSMLEQAKNTYQKALQIYRKLAEENPRTYLPYVTTTLNNLANLQSVKNEFTQALGNYEEALQIYKELVKENPRTYLPYVAATLNNLAILQKDKNDFPQALDNYEEALQIRRKLAKENPRTYLPDVAMTLNNLANLQSDKNEFSQALGNYEESLQIKRKLAKENPRTYLPNVAQTLNNLANLHLAKNEFPQALGNYEEALQIRRKLAAKNPRAYEIDYAKMLIMGVVYFKKDKKDLDKAEKILKRYKSIPYANKFLKMINKIKNNEY